METIFELSDILGIIIGVLLALLTAIAIIRIVIKTIRGDHIDVPPVGVMNDLPSSVTGINKHDDMRCVSEQQRGQAEDEEIDMGNNADNTGMLWPANGYRSLC